MRSETCRANISAEKTHSLKHFVYLVGLRIYYKMIHSPYNIKFQFLILSVLVFIQLKMAQHTKVGTCFNWLWYVLSELCWPHYTWLSSYHWLTVTVFISPSLYMMIQKVFNFQWLRRRIRSVTTNCCDVRKQICFFFSWIKFLDNFPATGQMWGFHVASGYAVTTVKLCLTHRVSSFTFGKKESTIGIRVS